MDRDTERRCALPGARHRERQGATVSVSDAKSSMIDRAIYVGVSALVILGIAVYVNGPVGPSTEVRGKLEGSCAPRGKQRHLFDCTAILADGSHQTFRHSRLLTGGTSVTFARRDRRYVGRLYELERVVP